MDSPSLRDAAYDEFVVARMDAGDDPNAITGAIEDALARVRDALARVSGWDLWGDGEWRRSE